jgi:hypothetical protein
MVGHACNSSIWEIEAREFPVQGQQDPVSKKKKKKKKSIAGP